MTKAKTAKSAEAKKPDAKAKKDAAPAAKPSAKPVKKAPEKLEKPGKPDKKAQDKVVKPEAAPEPKPAEAKKKAKSRETERIVKPSTSPQPQPIEASKPPTTESGRFMFGNSGLGIKTASKKPGLSVAPGVLILGRPAQTKQEQTPRPSERRLSKKEQLEIKHFLLEKRERLLAGMRRELAMQKERAESKAADEVDKATDAYDEDLSFEIATANDQELEEIQVALEKIEKGTYGECEVCGCAISLSRLKILPSATTCVSCRGQEELARRRDDGAPSFMMAEDAEGEAEPM